jgi:hypothetical protein
MADAPAKKPRFRLLRRRECLVPTWRGWLLLLVAGFALAWIVGRKAHSFLAVNEPRPGGLLVVEGWAPDYALKESIEEFRAHPYTLMLVTGGPLEYGAPLYQYGTYAEVATATLIKYGMSTNSVRPVPAPAVQRDRTYNSAVALGAWLKEQQVTNRVVNVLTGGPHGRRTRLLFEKALGKEYEVGILSIPLPDYDPQRWYRSSGGVRAVIGEGLAYLYARFLFNPKEE